MKSRLPSPALVLSVLALFAAFTGGAVAASKITGKQVKDGSITGKDIKNDSLTGKDIKGQVQGERGPRGLRGPAGPPGSAGAGGSIGNVVYRGQAFPLPDGQVDLVSVTCPDGLIAIGGGVTASGPVAVSWDRPAALTAEVPNGWEARVANSGGADGDGVIYAACIAASGQFTDDTPR